MNIDSRELFAPVYNRAFNDIFAAEPKHERWTFPGGRASCKSSFISLCVVLLIVMFPRYNAVIVRKYAKTMRQTCGSKSCGLSRRYTCHATATRGAGL